MLGENAAIISDKFRQVKHRLQRAMGVNDDHQAFGLLRRGNHFGSSNGKPFKPRKINDALLSFLAVKARKNII